MKESSTTKWNHDELMVDESAATDVSVVEVDLEVEPDGDEGAESWRVERHREKAARPAAAAGRPNPPPRRRCRALQKQPASKKKKTRQEADGCKESAGREGRPEDGCKAAPNAQPP
jgi:hypothetical protein